MALDSLADVADLPDVWQMNDDAQRALDVASAAIRDAAGCAIGALTSTVTVTGDRGKLLRLPGPVTAVTAVLIDGTAVTDYRVLPDGLWRHCGWDRGCGPVVVTVTMTFGLAVVPADIVALCAKLAVAWLLDQQAGGGSTAGLTSVKLDDAAEAYSDEFTSSAAAVYIPANDRNWLARRFGGGVEVVSTL